MKDFGTSDDPAVQAQLDRLAALSLPQGRLGLETIRDLMDRLGNPQRRLPPVFHVAGTNGKGSTCAFLRAIFEASGRSVHSTTSPHLVRYNERIRIAGELISDDALAALLKEVLDAGEDLAPSFFEVTIAASFLAFSHTPADVCVIEVGLGGRFDATNIIEHPAACGIAALGIDHERFLLAPEDGVPTLPIARIAFEKAGITKPGCPLVTGYQQTEAAIEIERAAMVADAPLAARGRDWNISISDAMHYSDRHGELLLPMPAMHGEHQAENAALAVAMIRHQDFVSVGTAAIDEGLRSAQWPARLQRLSPGPLAGEREVWLDGGHNPNAADAIATHFSGKKVHAVIGMLVGKDACGFLEKLEPVLGSVTAIPIPGYDFIAPDELATAAREVGIANVGTADTVEKALAQQKPNTDTPTLIAGSLYLAGEVLRLNDELPD